MEDSKIQWCHNTFNPHRGCARVSEGCRLCYAEKASGRNPAVLGVWGLEHQGGTRVVAAETQWQQPQKWNSLCDVCHTRERVFCASIADVFENWHGPMIDSQGNRLRAQQWYPSIGVGGHDPLTMDHVRVRLGDMIRRTPNLDWLLLTKRPENVLAMMGDHMFGVNSDRRPVIPPNVWIGATVENQRRADERGPELVKIRRAGARVAFMSCEPLLGAIDARPWLSATKGVNWVICGGESGAADKVSPLDLHWARMLRDQCGDESVPYFFKQIGNGVIGLTYKGKGGDFNDIPEDLRTREFPNAS